MTKANKEASTTHEGVQWPPTAESLDVSSFVSNRLDRFIFY